MLDYQHLCLESSCDESASHSTHTSTLHFTVACKNCSGITSSIAGLAWHGLTGQRANDSEHDEHDEDEPFGVLLSVAAATCFLLPFLLGKVVCVAADALPGLCLLASSFKYHQFITSKFLSLHCRQAGRQLWRRTMQHFVQWSIKIQRKRKQHIARYCT